MSTEPPRDPGGLTSGDPLGGTAPPEAPQRTPGYTTPPPPGAGGPVAQAAPGALHGQHVLSGWWRRAGAQVIDGLIIGVGGFLLLVAITAPFSIGFFANEDVGVVSILVGLVLGVICWSIVALIYAPALMARTNGQTLGRMATGIRVVRASGEPITFGFAMLREVAVKGLLFGIAGSITGGLANLVDYLWPLWDEENRALHDFVVNTRTILD
jgi:uncharacterized RDD family membrane protein YckC